MRTAFLNRAIAFRLKGDRLVATGRLAEARAQWERAILDYEKTLKLAPKGWRHATDVAASLIELKRRR